MATFTDTASTGESQVTTDTLASAIGDLAGVVRDIQIIVFGKEPVEDSAEPEALPRGKISQYMYALRELTGALKGVREELKLG